MPIRTINWVIQVYLSQKVLTWVWDSYAGKRFILCKLNHYCSQNDEGKHCEKSRSTENKKIGNVTSSNLNWACILRVLGRNPGSVSWGKVITILHQNCEDINYDLHHDDLIVFSYIHKSILI